MSIQLPASLLLDLQGVNGFDETAFLAAHQQAPPVSVRIHPVKGNSLFEDNEAVPWCASGRYLKERPSFTLDPAFHAGAYYVQEASSMFLAHIWQQLFSDKKNLRALDLCAAPGGKSTLIASLLDTESLLISNEVIRSRASVLEENMTRWGYNNTWVTSNDPRDFGRLPGYFDVMIVDAPCSGSGLFRKDVRALDEWTEANVQLCNARQQRILADAWNCLKENGVLIYATCSYSTQEDETILDWLGDTFEVEPINISLEKEWKIVPVSSPKNKLNALRFFPDKIKGEGFFIAVLRKTESAPGFYYPRFRSGNQKKVAEKAAYLLLPNPFVFLENDRKEFIAMQPHHEPDWQLLREIFYLRKAGILLGEAGQKEWLPAHDIALSIDKNQHLRQLEVDKEQALHFLKKMDLQLAEMHKGWCIVAYNGNGLGWIKALSNRTNNYLPKHWRIRMELPPDNWE